MDFINMDFIKKNISFIGIGGCVLGIIGLFLPFTTVSSSFGFKVSINFIEGDGKLVLVALIAAAVLLFLKKDLISLIASGVGGLITVYDAINVGKLVGQNNSYVSTNFSIGFYLLILGLIVAIGSAVFSKFFLNKAVNTNQNNMQYSQPQQMPQNNMQYNQPQQMPQNNMQYNQPQQMPQNNMQYNQPQQMPQNNMQYNQPQQMSQNNNNNNE